MADGTDWLRVCLVANEMSTDEATRLEATVNTSADELAMRIKLLGHYFRRQLVPEVQVLRHAHIHWLIDHHPEIDLGAFNSILATISLEAYEEAKRRWLVVVAERPDDLVVLKNAIRFLSFHDRALAVEMVRRGALAEPTSADWRESRARLLLSLARNAVSDDERRRLCSDALAEFEGALALQTSPLGRYQHLIDIAKTAYDAGNYPRATEAATAVLADAQEFKTTWIYGNGIHHGHIVLGRVALAMNDIAGAREHLAEAGATRGSPQLNSFGPDFALAAALIACGEHDAVIAYFDADL